jgi:hypothetical protein
LMSSSESSRRCRKLHGAPACIPVCTIRRLVTL